MGDLFKFLNDRFSALIQALKSTQQGYDESTHEYGGGGINNISDKTDAIKSTTDTIKTNTDSIKSSTSSIKSNTDTIKTNTNTIKADIDAIKTSLANVYTLLGSTRVIISRADYDALAVKDPNTIYYIKEPETAQPEPSNP